MTRRRIEKIGSMRGAAGMRADATLRHAPGSRTMPSPVVMAASASGAVAEIEEPEVSAVTTGKVW
jgi:hypothetical protein